LTRCAESTDPSMSCVPPRSQNRRGKEARMRWFGLDVHRDFCEVAVVDEKGVRSAGRIATRVPTLELFAQSLGSGDVVALEATTGRVSDFLCKRVRVVGLRSGF
jgi:hypothetical protein